MKPGANETPDLRREVVTPEGVPLGLHLAAAGERAAGFLIDLVIMTVVVAALGLLGAAIGGGLNNSWLAPLLLLASFGVRTFYFAFFELRWQGATPGKRVVKTRVIDADGGRLTADAIIARNLMREVEVFLPLTMLIAPEAVIGPMPGWATLLALGWVFVIVLLPLFNRDRLRVGDLVAGTCVVRAPRTVLLDDIGVTAGQARSRRGGDYQFTDAMLGHYGIYELQVLEQVIRGGTSGVPDFDAVDQVAARIRTKISWPEDVPVDNWPFIQAFYTAMRAHLEQRMLFGKRKADKHSD